MFDVRVVQKIDKLLFFFETRPPLTILTIFEVKWNRFKNLLTHPSLKKNFNIFKNLPFKKLFQSSSLSDSKSFSKSLKEGYESDSTLSYRRHQYIPQQSENKSLYTQVQKGGEVPPQGLRMQAPDKKGKQFNMFTIFV